MNTSLLSFSQIILYIPEILLVFTVSFLFLLDIFFPKLKKYLPRIFLLFTLLIFVSIIYVLFGEIPSEQLFPVLVIDRLALLTKLILTTTLFLIILLSFNWFEQRAKQFVSEYYILIGASILGAFLVISCVDFIMLYVALELLAIPLYILPAIIKHEKKGVEAAIKYLLYGALSTVLYLYGAALLYGLTGTSSIVQIAGIFTQSVNIFAFLGLLLIFLGLSFKIALMPFYFWAPDVYEAIPLPALSMVAVPSKIVVAALLIRIFSILFPLESYALQFAVISLIVVSISFANILALLQKKFRRMLAYSSISQAGYMLLALVFNTGLNEEIVLFYAASFGLANLLIIFCLVGLEEIVKEDNIDDYNGLSKISPFLAFCVSAGILSLIGMPPLAGFMTKLFAFQVILSGGYFLVALIAIINTVISFGFYGKVIKKIYFDNPVFMGETTIKIPLAKKVGILTCLFLLVFFGLLPNVFLQFFAF